MNPTEQQLNQLLESGDLDTAQRLVDSLDISSLDNVKILQLSAMVYRRLNDLDQVAAFLSKANNLEPDNFSLAIIYSQDLIMLGQLDMADAVLDSLPQTQQNHAYLLFQKSKILYQRKDFRSTTKLLVNLAKQYPDFAMARMELAHALLMEGKWRAGWEAYEWRFHLPKTQNMFPKFKMPHWDGSENLPHILLVGDQGYGDCFQFARYLPLVAQRCQRVSLIRSEPLARLFDAIPGLSSCCVKWEDTPLTSAYCTLSGLPRLFSTRPDTIPDCSGLLKADKKEVARWQKRLQEPGNDAKLRIGMAWSGRLEFENNYLRTVPFEKLETLLAIPGLQFFSLQVGAPASQAQTQVKDKNITDLSMELTDFAETAAAMEALDLIITTDTSVAHLAGTLGRPTWVLLSYAPDWRWGSEGSTAPWYPTMRLFRQDQPGNWQTVIDACKTMLQNIASANAPLAALSSVMQQDNDDTSNPYGRYF